MIHVDHIGIPARDAQASAQFLAEILGIAPANPDGLDGDMFCLAVGDVTSLLFTSTPTATHQHIAFRADPQTFVEVVGRLRDRAVAFGNDPEDPTNGRIDDPLGGHGRVYFVDGNGHLFEVAA